MYFNPKHRSPQIRRRAALAILAAVAVSQATSAQAAIGIWSGLVNSAWSETGNWDISPVPGSGDTAVFSGAGNGNTVIDLGGGVTISNLLFDTASAAAYTIGSGAVGSQTLSLNNAGGVTVNSGVVNNQLVNALLSLPSETNATTTIANFSSSLLTLAGGISAVPTNGNSVLILTNSGDVALTGALTETGNGNLALLKTGSGRLTISANSAWSGNGAIGRVPSTNGFPLVTREGTLLLQGGSNFVNGELVIGGVVADGGAGQNAKIVVDASTLNVNSWFSVGRGNGVGGVSSDLVLTNAGVVTAVNFSAGYDGGNVANLPKGSITLHDSSLLTISGNGTFNLGESPGSDMTLTANNSARVVANGTGAHRIGGGGSGTLNINDSASVSFGNQIGYVGYRTGFGVLNINGGTFTNAWGTTTQFRVGGSDINGTQYNSTGTVNVANGTMYVGTLVVARGNNNQNTVSGVVNINGGGTVHAEGDILLGFAGDNNIGRVVINGGTLNVATLTERWFIMGQWDTSGSRVDMNSGTLRLNANTDLRFAINGTIGSNVFNMNGGTLTFYSDNATTLATSGIIDMHRGNGATCLNIFNLNGGIVTASAVVSENGAGTRIFNFNGGTLRATPTSTVTPFLNLGGGSAAVNVRNGGAIIDSNGRDIAIASNLQHSDVPGDAITDGGLTKQGAGMLTIPSSSSFNGPLVVSGGTLSVDATSGAGLNVASVSLADNTGLRFTFSGNPFGPAINSVGGITAGANITISFAGSGFSVGQFPIIDYTGAALPNLNNFTLGALPVGVLSATLVNNTANSSIDINITAIGQSLTWSGTNNLWDIDTTFNWMNNVFQPTKYLEYSGVGDLVRFDDTLDFNALSTNVNLTTTLKPAAVFVDSANYAYSFTGAGSLAGSTMLVKSNIGSLTLGTANTHTGGTFIYGGTVVTDADSKLGASAAGLTLGGGNLEFTASTVSERPLTLAAVSGLAAASGATVQLNNTFIGNQRLNLDGAGVKVITNSALLNFHARGGTTVFENAARITNSLAWTSVAPLYDALVPTADARLIVRGDAHLETGFNDFNITDATVPNSGSSGRLDIQDNATVLFRNLWVGKGLSATGLVYQTGGTFSNAFGASADLRLGGNATDQVTAFGGYYLSGGRAEFRRLLQVGTYGFGEMVVSGGQFSNSAAVVVGRFGGSQGTLNVSGGSMSVGSDIIIGENGTGTMTVSGTGVALATSPLSIGGFGAPGTGTVTVATGGRLIVPQVRMMPVAGLSTLNLNGGTLEASASSSAFINNLTAANIQSGGAIIDSSSNNITIPQALLNGGGAGGLTKLGSGALTLLGTNNYAGPTVVSAGSLAVTPLHQTPSGAVTVADGASFGVFGSTNGTATVGNLSLGSAATDATTLTFAFNSNPTIPMLQVGVLTVNGTNSVRLAGTIAAGIVPLVKYTSLAGSGVLATNITGPQGMTAVLSNHVAGSTIYAVITGAPGIVWTGTNIDPAKANLWAHGVTNWLAAGNPAAYLETIPPGDPVTFNDLGNGTVLLSNTVSPASVVISNNSVAYTFSGPGKVSGLTSLTKRGTGTANIGVANDYSGATTVSAGTLQFGIANATGSSDLSVASGATVDLNGFAGAAQALSGSGLIDNVSGTQSTLTLGSGNASSTWAGVFTNTGAGVRLIKVGSGTNTFTATNYLAGQNQINGGKLVIGAGAGIAPVGTAEFWIAEGANTATVEVNGGYLGANNWFVVGRNNTAANGTLIINGGTVQKTGGGNVVVGSLNATGRLEVNGGQLLNNGMLWLGENASANATLQLNGGLVQATQVRPNNAVASSVAYFNGGVLQASASSTDFIASPTVAFIQNGGFTLDSQAFDVTIGIALTEDGNSPGGSVTKTGTGTLYMNAFNGYSGLTLVNNGTLAGIGGFAGPVTVAAGGTIRPGDASGTLGAMSLSGSALNLQGNASFRISKTGGFPSQDQIFGIGAVAYGGSLTISNVTADATPMVEGDTFQLFSATSFSGNFSSIVGSPGPGLAYSFNPASGILSVVAGGTTTPTNITVTVSGPGTLTLSWPESHLGWILQSQTNSLGTGLSSVWYDVAGSGSSTQAVVNVNKTNPAVFYRLRNP